MRRLAKRIEITVRMRMDLEGTEIRAELQMVILEKGFRRSPIFSGFGEASGCSSGCARGLSE